MTSYRLTRKHAEFLAVLRQYNARGDWPTYSELKRLFGYKSPNSVTQNYKALVDKGYLTKNESGRYSINDTDTVLTLRARIRELEAQLAETA